MLLRLSCYLLIHFVCSNAKIIQTRYGMLNGAEFTAQNGKLVHAFKHVPFALPPVGNLRYALPEPVQPWKGVRKAREYGPACLSNSTTTGSPQKWVDEDCLHVNIFVSDKCLKSACPVAVYLHGGAMNSDSAVMFSDFAMVNNFGGKDVVLVLPGFRLGFASHLTFSSEEVVPTNLGLHDIILSLKWIQSNIENFGGNRNEVTVFGHSYGGTAALILAFSKTIDPHKKLFHKAAALSPSITFTDPVALQQMTRVYAKRLGCTTEEDIYMRSRHISTNYEKELVRCLRTKDQKELLRVQRQMEEENIKMYKPELLLLDSPIQAQSVKELLEGHITPRPILAGTTLKEMPIKIAEKDPVMGADVLGFENPIAIGNKYASDLKEGKINFTDPIESQYIFLNAFQYVREMSKTGANAYLYEYDNPRHPSHTNDLFFIMGVHPFEMNENEKEIEKVYLNYFIEFIKTGKPHEEWKPFDEKLNNYWSVNFDVKTGLKPHNKLNYRREIVDCWLNELKHFDVSISLKNLRSDTNNRTSRSQSRNIEVNSTLSDGFIPFSPFSFNNLLFAGLLVLFGFFLGRCFSIERRPTFGYMQEVNEKTPLQDRIF